MENGGFKDFNSKERRMGGIRKGSGLGDNLINEDKINE